MWEIIQQWENNLLILDDNSHGNFYIIVILKFYFLREYLILQLSLNLSNHFIFRSMIRTINFIGYFNRTASELDRTFPVFEKIFYVEIVLTVLL